jgi:hypothetical protein
MNLDFDRRRKKYMGIYRWVGAGLLYCRLLTIIACETRPYDRSAVETATTLALRPRNARLKKKGDLKPDVM